MLHAPVNETKSENGQTKWPFTPVPERERYPLSVEAPGHPSLTGTGGGSILPSAAARNPSAVGSLQRLYGNQAVLQMRKGSGGPTAPLVPLRPSQSGILQRKCACGGAAGMSGECEECSQKKHLGLQTKLKVNEPGDAYEQEADRVADQVMAAPAPSAVTGAPLRIQRCAGRPTGQIEAPVSVDQALASPGRPLEPALRQDMEQRFGHDFSQVRVHTGTAAEQSARGVNAHAYTVGRNIVFAAGRFAPWTNEGRRLLAHELTHVVQQAHSPSRRIQRDTHDPPLMKPAPGPQQHQEYEIERRWKQLKAAAGGFSALAGWISAGDAVVALALDHENGYLSAIQAKDVDLAVAYRRLIDTDLTAYRYISWHVFVYQNLLRVRSSVDSLVSSFDHDKRDFTGRQSTEERVRALQDLIKAVPKDSSTYLAQLATNLSYKFRQGTPQEVPMTVTSAAYKSKAKALEDETRKIKYLQLTEQVILENTNDFLRTARKEGFKQAIEAVKEYYEVRQGILDSDDSDANMSDTQQGGGGGGSGSAGQGAGSGSAGQGQGSGSGSASQGGTKEEKGKGEEKQPQKGEQQKCPIPINLKEEGWKARGGKLQFAYTYGSSTGSLADLKDCAIWENVQYPGTADPYVWPNPPWNDAWSNPTVHPMVTNGAQGKFVDTHRVPAWAKTLATADVTAKQFYSYDCPCANGKLPVRTMAGTQKDVLDIRRRVLANKDGGTYRYVVNKSGGSAQIDPVQP